MIRFEQYLKNECFKKQKDRNERNSKSYIHVSKQFTLEMPITKLKAQDEFYARLENKDGEKSNHKLAKLGERKVSNYKFREKHCSQNDIK